MLHYVTLFKGKVIVILQAVYEDITFNITFAGIHPFPLILKVHWPPSDENISAELKHRNIQSSEIYNNNTVCSHFAYLVLCN